jgi:hypothetical protein
MAALIYRCPVTGMKVQAWLADDTSASSEEGVYVGMACPVCTWVHLVSPSTGRVLGEDEGD